MPAEKVDADARGPREPLSRWWESRLFLLLIGAVLTNFLAPRLQDTAAVVRWQRQAAYDASRSRTDAMRSFVLQLAELQALTADINGLAHTALVERRAIESKTRFGEEFVKRLSAWHAHKGKVAGHLTLFQAVGTLRADFRRYSALSEAVLLGLHAAVEASDQGAVKTASPALDDINALYDALMATAQAELAATEKRNQDALRH